MTFGIGILWLNPYIYTTMAHFYEDLRQRGESFEGAYAPVPRRLRIRLINRLIEPLALARGFCVAGKTKSIKPAQA